MKYANDIQNIFLNNISSVHHKSLEHRYHVAILNWESLVLEAT